MAVGRRVFPVLLLFGVGCVAYRPAPVDLASRANTLQSRRLSDPGLRAYAASCEGAPVPSWPPSRWDFAALTQAALYFSPAVAEARADEVRARAALEASGLRQAPGLSLASQYQTDAPPGTSPWTVGAALDIPLTAAGKRGIRQAEAATRLRGSQIHLQGTCWRVRSGLRAALVDWQFAQERTRTAARLAEARAEALEAMRGRFEAGEISAPEVETARAESEASQLSLASARQAEAVAHASLAGAMGLPESALAEVEIAPLDGALPDPPEEAESVTAALTGRSEVLESLSAYAASDQALRLAVAEQYPDLHLQPGYLWDQGALRWQLALSLLLPLLHQNRSAIAEAEAGRSLAGERVLSAQASVLRQVETARAAYGASRVGVESARAQARAREAAYEAARVALEAGEEDRLTLVLARVGWEAARSDEGAARLESQRALGALEDALERPLAPASPLPSPPSGHPAPDAAKETP